ncbi:MAG TPA: TolC family protein [Terriglobales bacterium]|nr:TolC family protein [Terriglobales bacterium]
MLAAGLAGAQATSGTFTGSTGQGTSVNVQSFADLTGQNPYQGSMSSEKPVPGVVPLTLLDAIDRGLKYNLGLYTVETTQRTVQAARLQALSNLLPNLNAQASDTIQQINLATFGLTIPGFPNIVGPFNVIDFRAGLSAPILDFQAINKLRSANQNVTAAQLGIRNARELVVVAVGFGYVQALAAQARVEAVQAQLNTAKTLYQQAVDQKNAGVVPAIDLLRAQVEMQAQQQRLVTVQNDFDKQKLQLARIIGLPVSQEFSLAQKIPYTPAPQMTVEDAIARSLRDRPDYAAAQASVRAAEYSVHAAQSERLPKVAFDGNYGTIGRTLSNNHGTFTAGAAITVPIFEGGRIKGDIDQAQATLNQRKAEAEDMRGRIEYEVRTAFLDLNAAAEQVRVAESTLDLAQQTLTQAQDRFRAGVTNNLEVVQAQEAVANSNDTYISSTLNFNLAKLALARSLGVAERATKEFLGGNP